MKYLFFDFDGTIADTIEPGLLAANEVLLKNGKPQISPEEFKIIRSMSYKEVMKKLEIRFWEMPKLLLQLRKKMKETSDEIKPYEGMIEVLFGLNNRGARMTIVTSNEKAVVEAFLKKYRIAKVFDEVYASKNLFGKGVIIKKFMEQNDVGDDAIYIGDEVRDIEAARYAGIESGAVTWGLQDGKLLKKEKPTMVFEKAYDIMGVLH